LPSVSGDEQETFSNIPSSENDTFSEAGGSATDGTVNYLYMKRSNGRVHIIHSDILVVEKEEDQRQERKQKNMLY
jgi:hypothetical protein